MSDGEVGEDVLEDLIAMLAERFPSVVGEGKEGGQEESTPAAKVDRSQWTYTAMLR